MDGCMNHGTSIGRSREEKRMKFPMLRAEQREKRECVCEVREECRHEEEKHPHFHSRAGAGRRKRRRNFYRKGERKRTERMRKKMRDN